MIKILFDLFFNFILNESHIYLQSFVTASHFRGPKFPRNHGKREEVVGTRKARMSGDGMV